MRVLVASLLIGGAGALFGLAVMRWRKGDPVGDRCLWLHERVGAWADEHGWATYEGSAASDLLALRASVPRHAEVVAAATRGDRGGQQVVLAYRHHVEDEVRRVEHTTVVVALDGTHPSVAIRSAVLPFGRRRAPTGDRAFDRLFVVEPAERVGLVTVAMRELLVRWRRSATGTTAYWLVISDGHLVVTRPGWATDGDATGMIAAVVGMVPDDRDGGP